MKRLRRTDITGQKFGKLTVIERNGYTADKDGKRISMWLCKCECGNTATVSQKLLVTGGKKSCGCIRKYYKGNKLEQHGKSHTRIYAIYCRIFTRCENPNDMHYKDYGARGIKICDEWKNSFQAFYEWAMNNGYKDNLSIDRIDVNGNYEPNNCRWATAEQQQNNRRCNVRYLVNGEELLMKQIVEKYGIPDSTLRGRMKSHNLTMQEAIEWNNRKEK